MNKLFKYFVQANLMINNKKIFFNLFWYSILREKKIKVKLSPYILLYRQK